MEEKQLIYCSCRHGFKPNEEFGVCVDESKDGEESKSSCISQNGRATTIAIARKISLFRVSIVGSSGWNSQ